MALWLTLGIFLLMGGAVCALLTLPSIKPNPKPEVEGIYLGGDAYVNLKED
jgi:hypothetical protein